MRKQSLQFFENICNAPGPSGFEREVARMVKEYVQPHCDEVSADKLGSLIFTKHGASKKPVVLLPGHSDEIGFLIHAIHESGYLKFYQLGGWPDQVLLGQRLTILTKKGPLFGVIAAKPPHLMKADERSKVVTKDQMFIDIGCSNADEAKDMGVRVGDCAVPDSTFHTITRNVFKDGKKKGKATLAVGKAFDNRAGMFVAAEAIRRLHTEKIKHPNTVVGAATSQEEVGLRGAATAGYKTQPDVCLALDVDIAGDVPGIDRSQCANGLGGGVSICAYDASLIPNQALKEFVLDTAEKCKIPYTITCTAGGGTDGGAVHKVREGCPSIYLGVPTRHIHSHVGILDMQDLENLIELVVQLIKRLDAKTVESFTAI
ncbi:M42 family metallopeptidase [Candidatus Sumerlaeota bacterium]|nr:M42 family metallopeptidase [Candidatus Sumerlaeota bacterium]